MNILRNTFYLSCKIYLLNYSHKETHIKTIIVTNNLKVIHRWLWCMCSHAMSIEHKTEECSFYETQGKFDYRKWSLINFKQIRWSTLSPMQIRYRDFHESVAMQLHFFSWNSDLQVHFPKLDNEHKCFHFLLRNFV